MQKIQFLSSKEKKRLAELLRQQFGADLPSGHYYQNTKDNIYYFTGQCTHDDIESLRISSAGLYFGELNSAGLRLSIEGSQIIALHATKNIVEIAHAQAMEWISGSDLIFDKKEEGFVIIKCNNDILGCGKAKDGKILNYVPKIRRIQNPIA